MKPNKFILQGSPDTLTETLNKSKETVRKKLYNACRKEACGIVYDLCSDLIHAHARIHAQILLRSRLPYTADADSVNHLESNLHRMTIGECTTQFARIWQQNLNRADSVCTGLPFIDKTAFWTKCSVDVFIHKTRTYAILKGNDTARTAFAASKNVIEYDYCENKPRPENISSQEWTARRRVWNKIKDEQLSRGSFSYGITSSEFVPIVTDEIFESHIPYFKEQTAKRIVIEKILAEKMIVDVEKEKNRIIELIEAGTDDELNTRIEKIKASLPSTAYECWEIISQKF